MSESLILAFERPSQGNPVPYIYVHWSNGYSELQEWMRLAKTFFGCLPLDSDISYAFARLVGLICVKRGIDKTTGVGVGITNDPNIGDYYDMGLWVIRDGWKLTHYGAMEDGFMES